VKLALIRQKYTDFGGAERYVSQLARRLLERGHEVHILGLEWRSRESDGLVFHRLPAGRGPTFRRLRAFAREAARAVEAGGFDLVHSFERTYAQDVFRAGDGCHAEFLARRARAGGSRQAWLDRINPRHRAFLDLEARLFADPRLKVVLANSRLGKREIMEHYGLEEGRVRVVYNGLDRNRFHPGLRDEHRLRTRAELGTADDEPVALFVGSGFSRKGLADLIRAAARLSVRVWVAGHDRAGPYRRLAAGLGLADRVDFLGPRSDVERLYGAADVFVLPSWYEPFANVCLEAMASGLPVVTSRETGAAEIVQPGVNGFTHVFPAEAEELAERIDLALGIDRDGLIRANRRLLEPFDWDRNLDQTLAVYQEVLGRI